MELSCGGRKCFLHKNTIYSYSYCQFLYIFSQVYTSAKAVQPHGDSILATLRYNVCYLALRARPALAVYWKGKNFKCFKFFLRIFLKCIFLSFI